MPGLRWFAPGSVSRSLIPQRLTATSRSTALQPCRGLAAIALLLLSLSALVVSVPAHAQTTQQPFLAPITIGFLRHTGGTWTARIADGGFEKATGRTIRWLAFDTDSEIAAAMAGGKLQIGMLGLGVAAAAYARGLDLRVFYVLGAAPESEGLLLADGKATGATDAKALSQKVIATPFGSTAHFRLLDSLKRWGLMPQDVRIVNLQTDQIASAWTRRQLDAAVVSQPVLGRLDRTGRMMPLARGHAMDGLVVITADAGFVDQQPVLLARLIDVFARSYDTSTDAAERIDRALNRTVVQSIALVTGLSIAEVDTMMRRFTPPALERQLEATWLGGGPDSQVAASLKSAAETWVWGGKLDAATLDYSKAVTTEAVRRALEYAR